MITRYSQYQLEKFLESLVLESKLEFSTQFTNILSSMKGNRIASELLSIVQTGKDADFIQNYIDISPEKDMVSFTPSRKAAQILDQQQVKWVTADDVEDRYFTFSKNQNGEFKNRHLFEALGFTPPEVNDDGEGADVWVPRPNTIGIIKGETISKKSGKTVVWFVSDDGKQAILNKLALLPYNESYQKLWTTSRTPFKVGRLAKSILDTLGIDNTPKEIEEFVNQYKSSFDIYNDAFSKFSLVSGIDIASWYQSVNYESMESTLGNSCMAGKPPRYFDIYVKNPEVCSLLILFSDGGFIKDGKYSSDKIKGRALVWKTDQGDILMDRVYTNNDSDVSLFKQYAESQGWWFKTKQNSDTEFLVSNGKSQQRYPTYTVKLKEADFKTYPYLDTLAYLNLSDRVISNSAGEINAEYELNSTGGYAEEI